MSQFRALISLALALALTGCQRPAEAPSVKRTGLRVLDINVWSGLDYKGNLSMGEYEPADVRAKRRQILIQQIRALDPDVIGVHEANRLPGYAEDLAKDLGFDQVNHTGVGGVRAGPVGLPWNLREGDAILAKKDLGLHNKKRLQLSGGFVDSFFTFHFDDATQILCADAAVNRRPLTLCTVHWHASPLDLPEVRAQTAALRSARGASDQEYRQTLAGITEGAEWRMKEGIGTRDFLLQYQDRPVLLFGDFNSTVETPEIQTLVAAGLTDTFGAANKGLNDFTWNPAQNLNQRKYYQEQAKKPENLEDALDEWYDRSPRRIDHIFLRPHPSLPLRVKSSRVTINQVIDGLHASDHFGIVTDFETDP